MEKENPSKGIEDECGDHEEAIVYLGWFINVGPCQEYCTQGWTGKEFRALGGW